MPDWPHSPIHRFPEGGVYMVTAATYQKQLLFCTDQRLSLLQSALFKLTAQYGWGLQAWAIFPNHYHFVAHTPKQPDTLRSMVRHLHSVLAREINAEDETPDRKVWFQYWDTLLSFESYYLARLNYVHNNPVKHGIVQDARQYRWCSARWFEGRTEQAFREMVLAARMDRVNVVDDF